MHTSPGQGEQVGYQKSFDVDNINAQKTACIWIACFNILVLILKHIKRTRIKAYPIVLYNKSPRKNTTIKGRKGAKGTGTTNTTMKGRQCTTMNRNHRYNNTNKNNRCHNEHEQRIQQ